MDDLPDENIPMNDLGDDDDLPYTPMQNDDIPGISSSTPMKTSSGGDIRKC